MDNLNVSEAFLEAWLSSPIFWKPEHIYLFLGKAHNSIKNDPEKKEKIKLGIESFQKQLWNNRKDWKHVLGDHFDLVTTFFQEKKNGTLARRSMNVDNTSAVDLIGVLRNRHEHNKDYDEQEKRSLGWFREESGNLHFDENLFIMYWISKFPTLGFVMWTQFPKEKGEGLPSFYHFTEKCSVAQFDPSQAVQELEKGLNYQKYKGYLSSRWVLSKPSKKIELQFRTVHEKLLKQLLGTSSAMIAMISGDQGRCVWKCNWYDKYGKLELTNNTETNTLRESNTICIVVGNRVADMNVRLLHYIDLHFPQMFHSRTVFFILNRGFEESTEEIQKIGEFVHKMSTLENAHTQNVPYSWTELPDFVQTSVLKQLRFEFQKRFVSLSDIFSKNEVQLRRTLLKSLDGDCLNQALKGKPLKIGTNLTLPSPSDFYCERQLVKRVVVNIASLQLAAESNFFVVSGIPENNLLELVQSDNPDIHCLDEIAELETPFHKYMLHYPKLTKDFLDRRELRIQKSEVENIHFLHYLTNGVFEWVHTFGSNDIIFNATTSSIQTLSELDLISTQVEKLILVAGVAGMGKSEFLRSCGHKLVANSNDVILISIEVSAFIGAFEDCTTISDCAVIHAIGKLAGNSEFEKKFMDCFLQSQTRCYKIELMLDSFDEVPTEDHNFAVQILSYLQSSRFFSRIWLTTREHLLSPISSKLQVFGYKFLPFPVEHQTNLLVMHWAKYFETNNHACLPLNFMAFWRLSEFAKTCLNSFECLGHRGFACVPLHCKMISEIYERRIYDGDFELMRNTNQLVDLYEQLLERKYQIYAKEKHQFSIPENAFANEILRDKFYCVHAYYAIKLLFSESYCLMFQQRLLQGPFTLKQLEKFALDFGIITSINPLGFIHRTLAECFVARHAAQAICDKLLHVTGDEERFYLDFFRVCCMYAFSEKNGEASTFGQMINDYVGKFGCDENSFVNPQTKSARERDYYKYIEESTGHFKSKPLNFKKARNILQTFFRVVIKAEPFEAALNLLEEFANYVKIQYPTVFIDTGEHRRTLLLETWPDELPNIDKYTHILQVFKRMDANFNAQDNRGYTILMYAVAGNYPVHFIKFLVGCGVDIFYRNINGETALHIAVKQEAFETVKILVNMPGADVLVKDKHGKIPADYAKSVEIRMLLNLKAAIAKPFLNEINL